MDDAGLEIGKPRGIRIRFGGKETFVSLHQE